MKVFILFQIKNHCQTRRKKLLGRDEQKFLYFARISDRHAVFQLLIANILTMLGRSELLGHILVSGGPNC